MNLRGKKRLVLFLGGLLLLGLFILLGGRDTILQFAELSPLPLALALAASFGITGAVAARWLIISNALGGRRVATWLEFYDSFMINRVLGFVLPKDLVDVTGRTIWANRLFGVPLIKAATSVVLDRLFDGLVIGIFLLGSLAYWFKWLSTLHTVILMVFSAVGFGLLIYWFHELIMVFLVRMMNVAYRLLHHLPWVNINQIDPVDVKVFPRAVIIKVYSWSVFKFGMTSIRLILFIMALGLPVKPELMVVCAPAGQLGYLFAITPGALGVFEAGWFAVLSLAGVGTKTASAFVVGQRVLTVVLIGFLALVSRTVLVARKKAAGTDN